MRRPYAAAASSARRSALAEPLALGAAGLALLVLGQRGLHPPRPSAASVLLVAGGLALWTLAATLAPAAADERPVSPPTSRPVRRIPLALAAGLAVVTWLETTGGTYSEANVAAWLVAVGAWCWAWSPDVRPRAAPRIAAGREWLRRHAWLLLALAAILAIGMYFRFHELGEIPSDPTSDHAEKLLDVRDVRDGARPVFFPRNTGREPAQFYFSALLIAVAGKSLSFGMLKWGTALVGTLAIPAVFLFADEVAGRAAGLAAAALYAVSAWPVETARAGLRFPYAQLAAALALWLAFRYIRTRDRRDALGCGLAIGFGLHGYTAFRIVPVVVAGLLVLAWLLRRCRGETWRLPLGGGGLIAATSLLACLPLMHYALDHPDEVSYRSRTRVVEGGLGWAGGLGRLLRNEWNALLAFNWRGDPGWVNAVRYAPLLDVVTGAALLAGVLLLVHELLTRRTMRSAALLLAAPVLMLPSALSIAFPIENPAVNRMGPVAPLVFLVAALPVSFLWQRLQRRPGSWRASPAGAGLLLAGAAVAFAIAVHDNYTTYFHRFAAQYSSFVPNVVQVAEGLRGDGTVDVAHMYVLGWPYWVDSRNVGFMLGAPDWYLDHATLPGRGVPVVSDGRPLRFALTVSNEDDRRELARLYPRGRYQAFRPAPGKEFAIYSVPAQ